MSQPPPLPTPPPLDYRTPSVQAPSFSLRIAILSWGLGFAIWVAGVFVVPKFEQVFKDFKVELPTITKCLLYFSRWMANDLGWLFSLPVIGALPVGAAFLVGIGRPTAAEFKRREKRAWRLAIYIALFIGAIAVIAIIAPMVSLIQSVSGGSSKR